MLALDTIVDGDAAVIKFKQLFYNAIYPISYNSKSNMIAAADLYFQKWIECLVQQQLESVILSSLPILETGLVYVVRIAILF